MLPLDLPGRWEVLVEEAAPGEAEHTLPRGVRRLPGQTLAELRRRLGGDEGELVDPVRGRHRVSPARWHDADPETRLRIMFIFTPDRPLPPGDARRMRVERRLLRAAMPASEAEARTLPELLDRPLATFRMEPPTGGGAAAPPRRRRSGRCSPGSRPRSWRLRWRSSSRRARRWPRPTAGTGRPGRRRPVRRDADPTRI